LIASNGISNLPTNLGFLNVFGFQTVPSITVAYSSKWLWVYDNVNGQHFGFWKEIATTEIDRTSCTDIFTGRRSTYWVYCSGWDLTTKSIIMDLSAKRQTNSQSKCFALPCSKTIHYYALTILPDRYWYPRTVIPVQAMVMMSKMQNFGTVSLKFQLTNHPHQ
jgi:hypothetical protein